MITDADRARICEAMGNGWRQIPWHQPPLPLAQGTTPRTEADFVLAVQKHFRIGCGPTIGQWAACVIELEFIPFSSKFGKTPEEAILLAALAVLDAKGGE